MKQLDTLLAASRPGDARDSRDEARPDSRDTDREPRPGRDHVDAINQMFAEFELAYHNQFHKAYAGEGSLALAKKYWLSCLAGHEPAVILRATRQVVRTHEYLPSLSVIAEACDNAHDLFGLPAPRDAYVEACCAPPPKRRHRWSHPAVYHAGCATDWYVLANLPESQAFPRFEYHYRMLCRRVMRGEHLTVESPGPLPEKAGRGLDRKENRARLNQLRRDLKL